MEFVGFVTNIHPPKVALWQISLILCLILRKLNLNLLYQEFKSLMCFNFSRKHTVDHNEARRLSSEPTLLTFNISEEISNAIELAKRNVDLLVRDLQMNFFTFDDFGVTEIKALNLSPDSFIQIAMQMAFIR